MNAFYNEHLLAGASSGDALRRLTRSCESFARAMPESEARQAEGLQTLISEAGNDIRDGTLRFRPPEPGVGPALRLYKERVGRGRVKLQLFPFQAGEIHPPHAHYNLLSCQMVVSGRAKIREFSLLERHVGGELEIREEGTRIIGLGEGVFTLQRLNNVHWQEGLEAGTLILNINWQGYFDDTPMPADGALHGRFHLDWEKARPAQSPGYYIVPELAVP